MYSLRAAQEEHNKLLLSYERAIKEKDTLVERIAKERDVTRALQQSKDLMEADMRYADSLSWAMI